MEGRALLFRKPAFGADQHGKGPAWQGHQCGKRPLALAASSSINQPPRHVPTRQQLGQRHWRVDHRHAQHTALLRGLDGVGAHALQIDAVSNGTTGQNRRRRATPISVAFWTM